MPTITLPKLFEQQLSGTSHHAKVLSTIDRACSFYGDPTRHLPFFPEYTDHGITHIQRVLDGAAALVAPEATTLLSSADAAVITYGVLLHDSAMHLTPEGFLSLIKSSGSVQIPELDSRSWAEEWEAYISEASRWDDRRLYSVLGDSGLPHEKWTRG